MIVIIPCVGYADFLRLILPGAKRFAQRFGGQVVVVTDKNDHATRALHDNVMLTDAWTRKGYAFDKGLALKETCAKFQNQWVCCLDADTYIPPETPMPELLIGHLYGAQRLLCHDIERWNKFASGEEIGLYTEKPHLPFGTNNPAACSGFFQLFYNDGVKTFDSSRNAAGYDDEFALQYHDDLRHWLPFRVLHIGPTKVNWNGRTSELWANAKVPDV